MNLPIKQHSATQPSERARIKFDLMDPIAFEHIQRVAGMYANSPLFPAHLRAGGQAASIANAVLVMNMAERLREDPLTVAQNIYFVSGKPGWSASYMISKANQHGVFAGPIDWDVSGKGDSLSVTAFGVLATSKKKVSATMSMDTAKKEGWTSNKKYQSMPEQMLRYRSATALIRLYCPEVMVGVPPGNEIEDETYSIRDITPSHDVPAQDDALEDDVLPKQESKPTPAPKARKPIDRTPPPPAEVEEVEDAVEVDEPAEQEDAAQESAPAPEAKARDWSGMAAAVKKDLDGMEPDDKKDVIDFYAKELRQMEVEDPDLFARLCEDTGLSIENMV